MTRRLIATVVSCVAFLLAARTTTAADRVQSGEWETRMTLQSGKPLVSRYCISAADAESMNGDLPTLRKYLEESTKATTQGRCKVKNVELKGNRTIVTIACGKRESVGTTTYHGDHYESSSSDGTTVTGKRVGACPMKR